MNPIEDIRKLTVREAVIESLEYHTQILNDAKNGVGKRGHSAETVLSWYKKGGSRHHLINYSEKKLEKLTFREITNIFVWHKSLYNCSNFCKTCGSILYLDSYFWFVPMSYCGECKCGFQLCQTCLTIIGRTE